MRDTTDIQGLTWYRQPVPRLMVYFRFKLAAFVLYMVLFFTAYFLLLKHPLFPVTPMPATALDRLIGFHPQTLVLYLSLWLYVSLAPSWLLDWEEILAYYWSVWGLGLVGCLMFLLWPTASPPPDVDWTRYPSFAFLKSVDDAGNACPSLHVAFALLSALWTDVLLKRMRAARWALLLNWGWCLGIVVSTMATKQHVALDAYAGALLGAAWFVLHRHWLLPLVRERAARRRLVTAGSGS
jgi:membrane-associated phospholipid phosphatase